MEKVKIGVLGAYRGKQLMQYCCMAENAELVAICDKNQENLDKQKEARKDMDITYYTDFDEFIKHDMDAVILANYAHQHAPFAIKCLKAGKNIYSEVLPCQNMQEAVELVETVEKTGKIYAFGENFCYMPAPAEMKRLYNDGVLGELEYAEGEYIHNCEDGWADLTYGDKNHWRNRHMYANFYCTHSLGPIIHITGLRPVSVVGFESTMTERSLRIGKMSGQFGIEMVTMENGAIVKSIHGDLYKNSLWYSLYGSKGRIESGREDPELGAENGISTVYVSVDEYSGQYEDMRNERPLRYKPRDEMTDIANSFSHVGSDFYSIYHFTEKIRGNEDADVIDVYEAMDMFLPGMFAYRSVLAGGIPMEVPNLRDKAIRDKYRNDTTCTDPEVAGDMLIPVFSKGNPEIPDEVYERLKKMQKGHLW